jgi:two-component system NtrC family sensor kinase
MRNSMLIAMLAITLIPMAIISGINFAQYRQLLQNESYANARWSAESARATINAYLEKMEAAITVVLDSYTFEELTDQHQLDQIFRRLKEEHQGLVDIGVIGSDGIQITYAGPYKLVGNDYNDSIWFHKALTRKIYVSEVFTGFRNVPHFVVAASKKGSTTSQDYWVLRASIDSDTLDHFLASVNTGALEDIFLINDSNKLQSSSRYHGNVLEDFQLGNKPKQNDILISAEGGNGGFYRAVSRIPYTPWLLVLDHQGYSKRSDWQSFKRGLMFTLISCSLVFGCIIIWLSAFIAGKIREADEMRDALLSETEHNNKLASIGRLAAGVAHEINNPLAIIGEKAGLMQDLIEIDRDFHYRDKFLRQLSSLQDAVGRARTITHRLLGFARRMETSLTLVHLNDIIREVFSFLEKEAAYNNIHIILQLQKELPVIRADHGQLQQVLLNVTNNAIDAIHNAMVATDNAMEEISNEGEILITSQCEDKKTVQVIISDTGPGMSAETMKNIFEPFFTTKGNAEKKGTGLGLSISYGIVQKLGGKIEVNSEIGVGTTFIISFPVYSERSENDGHN